MSQYKPRTSAGISKMIAVNRTTKMPYGMIRVINGADPSFDREQVDLYGGSNPNPWDSLDGNISAEVSLTIAEFKPFLYDLAGFTKTGVISSEASGNISTLTNEYGTSVQASGTGIASAALSTGATAVTDLKRGKYFVKCVSATTVDVYALQDNDFLRGNDIDYESDDLKITDTALTITASTVTEIPNIGVKLTGSTGAIAMTTGDVATFEVRTPNEGYYEYIMPENPIPIEFDMWLVSQKKSNEEYFIDRYPRCKFNSIPGDMSAKEWSEVEITVKALFDNTLGFSYKRYDEIIDLS